MSYKTILMHLNHTERAPQILAAGVQLAREFQAHLIGLYVFPAFRVRPPVPVPLAKEVVGRIMSQIREDETKLKEQFIAATAQQPFVAEWRSVVTEKRDPTEVVLDHGRAADLIIAGQSDPDWYFTQMLDFPERLAMESGRPVLLIPKGLMQGLPNSITVAWKPCREAARAVADAMPLMKKAKLVQVLTVDEGDSSREGALPDNELANALARHDLNVNVTNLPKSNISAGEEIRRRATEQSTMLVMGAYGHSRLREFVMGGVTRHVFSSMTIPVLVSH